MQNTDIDLVIALHKYLNISTHFLCAGNSRCVTKLWHINFNC